MKECETAVDVQDCALAEFTLDFFYCVADADFETVSISGDGFLVFEFHCYLAGEDSSDGVGLVEDLEGVPFDFDYACDGIDTDVS